MQGMKSLVIVEMVMQNIVTRVTYRVTSTLPIGMILPKVSYTQHLHKIGYIGARRLQFFGASCCCLKESNWSFLYVVYIIGSHRTAL